MNDSRGHGCFLAARFTLEAMVFLPPIDRDGVGIETSRTNLGLAATCRRTSYFVAAIHG